MPSPALAAPPLAVAPPPRSYFGLPPAWVALWFITTLTLFRFFLADWLPPLPDEAYYLQWSHHLDASYFSKGPAIAYTIAAGTTLGGVNNFGLRFFAVLLSAGTSWQLFLFARRWFGAATALLAVLIAAAVPIFAIGAVLMTIDPLSAFFWLWAANLFSRAIESTGYRWWIATGFAVGSGFLAKYLNALELLAFTLFLLGSPARRVWLRRPGPLALFLFFALATLPVLWWNARHGWSSVSQLGERGHLNQPAHLSPGLFGAFLGQQAVVISPLLFLALLAALGAVLPSTYGLVAGRRATRADEGAFLCLLLFGSVFGLYALLAWHLRQEPNWPAISYLTALPLLARRVRSNARAPGWKLALAAALTVAWVETVLLGSFRLLPLPPRLDPLNRTLGWREVAQAVQVWRGRLAPDLLVADAYKEASILSYDLPDRPFIAVRHHWPPKNQFDFWPGLPEPAPPRVLWICEGDQQPDGSLFTRVQVIEHLEVWIGAYRLRNYTLFLCTRP